MSKKVFKSLYMDQLDPYNIEELLPVFSKFLRKDGNLRLDIEKMYNEKELPKVINNIIATAKTGHYVMYSIKDNLHNIVGLFYFESIDTTLGTDVRIIKTHIIMFDFKFSKLAIQIIKHNLFNHWPTLEEILVEMCESNYLSQRLIEACGGTLKGYALASRYYGYKLDNVLQYSFLRPELAYAKQTELNKQTLKFIKNKLTNFITWDKIKSLFVR